MVSEAIFKEQHQIEKLQNEINKQAKIIENLREIEDTYISLLKFADDHIAIVDRNCKYQFLNEKVLTRRGMTLDQRVGLSYGDLHDEDDTKEYASKIEEVANTGRPAKMKYRSKIDGRYFLRTFSPVINNNGQIKSVIVTAKDITERIEAEKNLRHEKELSEGLINSSFDGILAFDLNCCYTIWNPGMERISGVSKDQALGKFISEVFPFLKKIGEDKYHFDALEGKHSISKDKRYIVPETGKEGFFEADYSPLLNESNEVIGGIGIVRDITERKSFQTTLANRSKALEEVNTALKILLKKREKDKVKTEERIAANIRELIVPYLQMIENSPLSRSQKKILEIITANIEELTKSFSLKLSSRYFALTPTEIRVANLIKQGFKTKEIASSLKSSYKTIESHREKIRKKLGITNQNRNLRSFLLSFN